MKKQTYIIFLFCSIFVLLPVLSGCWDQTTIDDRAYVVAIGLDKSEDIEDHINISYLIANPQLSKQERGSNENPSELITFPANDLTTAKSMANAVISKEISYNLLTVLIVSEEFAKDDIFIRWMYDATKDKEIKRHIHLIVTKEKVSKYLKETKPKLETRMHKYFDLITQYGSEKGYIPESDISDYFRVTEADADLYIAIYSTTDRTNHQKSIKGNRIYAGDIITEGTTNKTQFLGSALFKEGKMIATLTASETRISVLLNETLNMEEILTTFSDPFSEKFQIGLRIQKKEPNIVKMDLKREGSTIDVTIPLYIDVLSNHNMVNYVEHKEKKEQLKAHIKKILEGEILELVKKSQEEWKGQPFGWSLIARKQFKTIQEFENFDWMNSYPNMKVKITVDIRFGHFGRQSEIPNLQEIRD